MKPLAPLHFVRLSSDGSILYGCRTYVTDCGRFTVARIRTREDILSNGSLTFQLVHRWFIHSEHAHQYSDEWEQWLQYFGLTDVDVDAALFPTRQAAIETLYAMLATHDALYISRPGPDVLQTQQHRTRVMIR